MAKVGVEPKTFELLARRSNQLSYSASRKAAASSLYQHQLRYRFSGTSLRYCYPHTRLLQAPSGTDAHLGKKHFYRTVTKGLVQRVNDLQRQG